jgi:hypothetical protein
MVSKRRSRYEEISRKFDSLTEEERMVRAREAARAFGRLFRQGPRGRVPTPSKD